MGALRLATVAALAGLATAGCGGTGTGPPATAPAETGATAVVASPAAASAGGTPVAALRPAFPARAATDVISLAQLHPPGTVVYDVRTPSGEETIRISRFGSAGAIEQRRNSVTSWVGFANSRIVYACTTASGEPVCRRGDKDGAGAKVAYAVAKLLGADAVRTTFSPLVGATSSRGGVGQDTQLGETVSCMALSADNADYRLCATKAGQITQLSAGPTTILATSLGAATPKDVAPPTVLQ